MSTETFCEPPFLHFQVTFAYIPLPGCKQPPSERQAINLNFSPHVDESFEKVNPFLQGGEHQCNIMSLSGLRRETCQQGHICFSVADDGGWAV